MKVPTQDETRAARELIALDTADQYLLLAELAKSDSVVRDTVAEIFHAHHSSLSVMIQTAVLAGLNLGLRVGEARWMSPVSGRATH